MNSARKNRKKRFAQLVEVFLAGKSARTSAAYLADLGNLAKFMRAGSAKAAAEQLVGGGRGNAWGILERYKGAMLAKGLAVSTINRRLATVRSLLATAGSHGLELIDWTIFVRGYRSLPLRDTRGPGREAVRTMIDLSSARRDCLGLRDKAILWLASGLALRRAEICELSTENVDLAASTVSVLGKGRHERVILAMPPQVRSAVGEWITARPAPPGPLFIELSHESLKISRFRALSGKNLYSIVAEYGRLAGVKATPHGLRHTAITEAVNRGFSIHEVMQFARHAKIETTARYFDEARRSVGEVACNVAQAFLPDSAQGLPRGT